MHYYYYYVQYYIIINYTIAYKTTLLQWIGRRAEDVFPSGVKD